MTSFVSEIVVDSRDPYAQSLWWAQVLGYAEDPDDPNEPDHELCLIRPQDGAAPDLLFIRVPEDKTVKNRLHLDLRPHAGQTLADELARLIGLGARKTSDHRYTGGRGWVVLADPEGNEFCLLHSEAELAAAQASTPST